MKLLALILVFGLASTATFGAEGEKTTNQLQQQTTKPAEPTTTGLQPSSPSHPTTTNIGNQAPTEPTTNNLAVPPGQTGKK